MKEAGVASHIRLEAPKRNVELWRNNVGVLVDARGRPVRFGLANDSSKLNKKIKSSDLIGITPVRITPDMIGQVIGVFTAVETKKEDWKFNTNDERAVAQKKFHDIVKKSGGYAGFASSVKDFLHIIKHGG